MDFRVDVLLFSVMYFLSPLVLVWLYSMPFSPMECNFTEK